MQGINTLLVSKFGPSAISASEAPQPLDILIYSADKNRPVIFVYKYLMMWTKFNTNLL